MSKLTTIATVAFWFLSCSLSVIYLKVLPTTGLARWVRICYWGTLICLPLHLRSMSKRFLLVAFISTLFLQGCIQDFHRHSFKETDNFVNTEFARVGYVSANTAKFTVRSKSPASLLVAKRSLPAALTANVSVDAAGEDIDFLSTVHVEGLLPKTEYVYKVVRQGDNETTPLDFGAFRTPVNEDEATAFHFVTSSSMIPNWPYTFTSRGDYLSIPGADVLADSIKQHNIDTPDFLLFLGGFIDSAVGHVNGDDAVDIWRARYRQRYASPSYKRIYRQMSTIHTYDDADIVHRWDRGNEHPYPMAKEVFVRYHHEANPPVAAEDKQALQCSVLHNGYETLSVPLDMSDGGLKTMLGGQQRSKFIEWIHEKSDVQTPFKFVVSSVPFAPPSSDPVLSDMWNGYQYERELLLKEMAKSESVFIFLTGHQHDFGAYKVADNVYEFSISPLSHYASRTNLPEEPQFTVLAHENKGMSKFGAYTVNTTATPPFVRFQAFIDGAQNWETVLTN
ncbi:alkaline phosphatase [Schizosaccharomyces japonicus yFS275]|uniref:Alkaline phosphatase n=1 Tax=Schizosaccharomyces japonicus (strain yFS275 / FY16936) TaxID=402676 RepID=B6K053_SCHJY|nr:alkaline phosphatase [Schizosaccharomyces japonicus yFS275]EEB06203.2 alkaline phosphatase [Schizosaccharomyces japonicus yFS275]